MMERVLVGVVSKLQVVRTVQLVQSYARCVQRPFEAEFQISHFSKLP